MKMILTGDRIIGAAALLTGILVCLLSAGLPESKVSGDIGSAAFPMLAAIMLIVCGGGLIIKKPQGEQKPFLLPRQWLRVATLFGSYIVFAVALWGIGFLCAVPVFLFWLTYILGRADGKKMNIIRSLIFSIAVTAFFYILYQKVMVISLPKGVLFN